MRDGLSLTDQAIAYGGGSLSEETVRNMLGSVDRGHVRLYVNRGQAAAFCERADDVIEAGRPTCRWCGNPMDLDGHLCARMN